MARRWEIGDCAGDQSCRTRRPRVFSAKIGIPLAEADLVAGEAAVVLGVAGEEDDLEAAVGGAVEEAL